MYRHNNNQLRYGESAVARSTNTRVKFRFSKNTYKNLHFMVHFLSFGTNYDKFVNGTSKEWSDLRNIFCSRSIADLPFENNIGRITSKDGHFEYVERRLLFTFKGQICASPIAKPF